MISKELLDALDHKWRWWRMNVQGLMKCPKCDNWCEKNFCTVCKRQIPQSNGGGK